MPPQQTNAEKRLARMRRLIDGLNELAQSNTEESRFRSRRIAAELIELLKAEDEFQRTLAMKGAASRATEGVVGKRPPQKPLK